MLCFPLSFFFHRTSGIMVLAPRGAEVCEQPPRSGPIRRRNRSHDDPYSARTIYRATRMIHDSARPVVYVSERSFSSKQRGHTENVTVVLERCTEDDIYPYGTRRSAFALSPLSRKPVLKFLCLRGGCLTATLFEPHSPFWGQITRD